MPATLSLPSQTGNSGKFLTTNGTALSWASAGGGPAADNTTDSASAALRWRTGYFGTSLRLGDGTNGAQISTAYASPDQSLVLRGSAYQYSQAMKYAVILNSPLILDYNSTGTPGSSCLLINNGANLEVLSANRFGFAALTASNITAGGNLTCSGGSLVVTASQTPANAGAAGSVGTIAWDSSYIYVCTAANTWKRAALATW